MSGGPGRAPSGPWLPRAWDFNHWAVGSPASARECGDAACLLEKASGHWNTWAGGWADRRQHGERIEIVLCGDKEDVSLHQQWRARRVPGTAPGCQVLKT